MLNYPEWNIQHHFKKCKNLSRPSNCPMPRGWYQNSLALHSLRSLRCTKFPSSDGREPLRSLVLRFKYVTLVHCPISVWKVPFKVLLLRMRVLIFWGVAILWVFCFQNCYGPGKRPWGTWGVGVCLTHCDMELVPLRPSATDSGSLSFRRGSAQTFVSMVAPKWYGNQTISMLNCGENRTSTAANFWTLWQ